MDGVHDLGGRQGFGHVRPEADEPVFHGRWEARVFACQRGLAGVAVFSTDHFRHAVERIRPEAYLTHGYYGRWLGALETMALEAGVIERQVLDARARALGADSEPAAQPDVQPPQPPRSLPAPMARAADAPGRTALRPLATPPAFAPGVRVRTLAHGVSGHTRLPAYARGRVGTVVAWHDGWVYPDTNAHQRGEHPQHLYTVAFDGAALWGEDAEPGMAVMLDLFEPYLMPAEDMA